jgi:hypothetical protein
MRIILSFFLWLIVSEVALDFGIKKKVRTSTPTATEPFCGTVRMILLHFYLFGTSGI